MATYLYSHLQVVTYSVMTYFVYFIATFFHSYLLPVTQYKFLRILITAHGNILPVVEIVKKNWWGMGDNVYLRQKLMCETVSQ